MLPKRSFTLSMVKSDVMRYVTEVGGIKPFYLFDQAL